jgi:hypothetical protein
VELTVALPGRRGEESLEFALLLAFVCFTGDVFVAPANFVEDFVEGFGFVIPVFTLSDLDVIVLFGIAC